MALPYLGIGLCASGVCRIFPVTRELSACVHFVTSSARVPGKTFDEMLPIVLVIENDDAIQGLVEDPETFCAGAAYDCGLSAS